MIICWVCYNGIDYYSLSFQTYQLGYFYGYRYKYVGQGKGCDVEAIVSFGNQTFKDVFW